MPMIIRSSCGYKFIPWEPQCSLRKIFLPTAIAVICFCWMGFEAHCLQRERRATAILATEYGAVVCGTVNQDGGTLEEPTFDPREIRHGHLYVPMKRVFIANAVIDLRAWDCLKSLTHLDSLKLQDCRLDPEMHATFSDLRRLTNLDISDTRLAIADVCSVASLRQLEDLALRRTGATDEWLAILAPMRSLRSFTVDGEVSDVGVSHLASLRRLLHLSLAGTKITSSSGATFARLTTLQELSVADTAVGDDCLIEVGRLSALEQLGLRGTAVTDAGMSHLANLTKLQYLYLRDTRISDIGVGYLAKLPELVGVDLSGTDVTIASLNTLASMRQINRSRVVAADTQISDFQFEKWQAEN